MFYLYSFGFMMFIVFGVIIFKTPDYKFKEHSEKNDTSSGGYLCGSWGNYYTDEYRRKLSEPRGGVYSGYHLEPNPLYISDAYGDKYGEPPYIWVKN